MRDIEEFLIPELQAQLGPLESGKIETAKRYLGGSWINTTQDNIRMLRQAIIQDEAILAMLRDGETPQTPPKSARRP
jgi:hypothetical protein